MLNLAQPDPTQHPPRSVRTRLGGFCHLPRLLDKARAFAAGKNGGYHYNCPLDRNFFDFTGIDHEALLAEVKKGGSDTEILTWVRAHTSRSKAEIHAWTEWLDQHGPGGVGGHEWIAETVKAAAGDRDDIRSFADLLDLDDYVSYGGKG
ncbi:DUF5069 domain-containing protein [Horticoccus luteus]|uniref:DUF5069 domain-containing protein n=1 Tax=Horticoccus luteus TaxID=2862869 RepID=A0A8F9XKR6_9BACT|nr:DUF5069 domain-containing protein [Horticoccus luteus]QYM79958.1 DUF5069 domain-containing protein [Horticoccus luteus]